MRQKAHVARHHLIETSLADVDRADLHRYPGWSATVSRCAVCQGEGAIEFSDHLESCDACAGSGMIGHAPRRRRWWSTAAELLAIGGTLTLFWVAWTMLP